MEETEVGSENASYATVLAYLTHKDAGNLSPVDAKALMAKHPDELSKGVALHSMAYFVGDQMLEKG